MLEAVLPLGSAQLSDPSSGVSASLTSESTQDGDSDDG